MGNKEVRDILLGRIVRQNEQFWIAAPSNVKFHFYGIRDGAADVRLFGVMNMSRNYWLADVEPDIAFAAAEKALYSIGRPLRIASMPEAKGCFYAPNWIAPVLLTVEQDGDAMQMTAYTGRSLLASRIRCRIALWILERRMPEGIIYTGKRKKLNREEPKKQEQIKKRPAKKEPIKKEPIKQETSKRAGKRVATPKNKKATPKRLKK